VLRRLVSFKESFDLNPILRLGAIALAAAGLFVLAGCDAHPKTLVAEVNQDTIDADEYNARVQGVTSIPEALSTDAGGVTLINMIRDRLTDQLAKKVNAVPAPEVIEQATEYQMRVDPATGGQIAGGKLTRDDLRRQKKFELEAFGIGTNGDKPTEQDIDKAYEEYKDKPDFKVKASYTIRLLRVPDDLVGRKVIADLQKTGDFKAAALKYLGMTPQDAATLAKDQTLFADQMPAEMRSALNSLKPNEITPAPVMLKIANPQQPLAPQLVYIVAQLKSKEIERVMDKASVRFLLIPIVLQKTHPQWKEHYKKEIADFTRSSQIHVGLQKYEPLVDSFVRPPPAADMSARPAPNTTSPPPPSGP